MGYRFKRDGETIKNVKLIGKGFLSLVDHLFWYLPFTSVKQATQVREKNNIADDAWDTMRCEISEEHDAPDASQQLADGWKSFLADSNAINKEVYITTVVPTRMEVLED